MNDRRPIQGLFRNEDGWLLVRVCVSDISFLHKLRAGVLSPVIQSALHRVQPGHRGLSRASEAQPAIAVEVDLSHFALRCEEIMFSLDKLTKHQQRMLKAACVYV